MSFLRQLLGLTFVLALTGSCADGDDSSNKPSPRPAESPLVSMEELVTQLTDLDRLTRAASPAYETLQFSSWDRRSVSPADPTENGWFANLDWDAYLGETNVDGRLERIMAEVVGAGALVRVWAADPKGTLRIYVDDFSKPAIEVSMEQLLTGDDVRFPDPFAYVAARGHNFYFPVPFSECLRVTTDAEKDEKHYYHVNVRRYEDGTTVESWSDETHEAARTTIQQAAETLRRARNGTRPEGVGTRNATPVTIAAPTGGGVIRRISVETSATANQLRQAVLSIRFDGNETVRTPLGDFFGTGPGIQEHHTLALSTDDSGRMTSYFPMPFADSTTIDVEGLDVEVEWEVEAAPFDERSLYFHARWNSTGVVESQPKRDLDVAMLSGSGVYVGTHLLVDNPINEWWGEGDEKIYVDGSTTPTWFGTGTEDYFGYAFTDLSLFSAPYHSQSRTGLTTQRGHISNFRAHVIDPLQFRSTLDFDLELWAWVGSEIALHWISYWYGSDVTATFPVLEPGTAPVFDVDTFRR